MGDGRPVMITGVAGFIGGHTAALLARQGVQVVGVDSTPPEEAPSGLHEYASITLPDPAFGRLLADVTPRALIHCAGLASVPRSLTEPGDDYRTNTAMTFETLDAIRARVPDCHFLFPSSAAVYGDPPALPITESAPVSPISPYGFHKLQAEVLCREFAVLHGLRTTVLRIFSAYGPGLRKQVLWDLCRKALTRDEVVLLGEGDESRDFIHVEDIAAAFAHLIARPTDVPEGVVNVGSGEETPVAELARILLDALDRPIPIRFEGVAVKGNPRNWRADITRLAATGFASARGLGDGVTEYARWARDQIEG